MCGPLSRSSTSLLSSHGVETKEVQRRTAEQLSLQNWNSVPFFQGWVEGQGL